MAIKRSILIFVLCSLFFAPVFAESVKDLQKKQKKLQEQIEQTNKMLKQTKRDESATVNKLNLINQNIKTQKQLIRTLDNEIVALDRQMNSLTNTRDSLQVILERYKADYAQMVRQSHYARIQQSPLLFLLSSDSFQQLARRARYLQEFAHFRQEQVRRIENTQAEIDTQNELLQANKSDKQTALNSRKREQENLKRDERKQQNMLSQLKSKEKDLNKQLQQQQKKVNELNKKIDDMIRKQTEKASKTTLTKEQQLLAGGFEQNKGRLPWPVEKASVLREYGVYTHPSGGKVMNNGIEILTSQGSSVRSVFQGEVSKVFTGPNQLKVVMVRHGDYITVYTDLENVTVKEGNKVATKQKLGTVHTNDENKAEFNFQIWKVNECQNPRNWLAK